MTLDKTFAMMTSMFLLISASGSVFAQQENLPDITEEGLHRVPDSKLAVVYAEPGADLAQYDQVALLDAYVAFRKNWERDQRRSSATKLKITSRDVEDIKKKLSEEFDTVFRETLEAGGYEVVDAFGENVLLVRPAIINLDVNAPDTPTASRSTTFVSSAGEMTLYIELYDSVTGDLIAKALDRRADPRSGFYTWSNTVTNRAASLRILKGWADILLDALNEAKHP